jgi:hypothetical protein
MTGAMVVHRAGPNTTRSYRAMSIPDPTVQYREIPGWFKYLAGDDGLIVSVKWCNGTNFRILTQVYDSGGYAMVSLCQSGRTPKGRSGTFKVHCLVMAAFGPSRPSPIHQIRHWDGNKLNNRPDNLLWGTPSENKADSIRHGTTPRGDRSGSAKLDWRKVEEIRHRKQESCVRLAAEYGVNKGTICRIIGGKTWSRATQDAPDDADNPPPIPA